MCYDATLPGYRANIDIPDQLPEATSPKSISGGLPNLAGRYRQKAFS
jgi:hypothetical protein